MADFYTDHLPIHWRGGTSTQRPTKPTSVQQGWFDTDTTKAYRAALVAGQGLVWLELAGGGGDLVVHTHQDNNEGGQLDASAVFNAGAVPLARGGTGTDLSGTGGTGHVVKQTAAGANLSVAPLDFSDLTNKTHTHQDAVNGGQLDASTVFNAGAVPLARGGLGADASAWDGLVTLNGGSASPLLCNFGATTAPTAGEDANDGYAVGSIWIDTTADKVYVCVDATAAAAVWVDVSPTGGAGGAPTDAAYILQSPDGDLTNAQALNALADGLLKHAAGVLSQAVAGTDYLTPDGVETLSNKTYIAPRISDSGNVGDVWTRTDALGNGAWIAPETAPPPQNPAWVILEETQPRGVNNGTLTAGTPLKRNLALVTDTQSQVSITSGEITFAEDGTWFLWARAPGYKVDHHRIWMENTATADKIYGTAALSSSADQVQTDAWLRCRLTVTAGDTFKIMHDCQTSKADNGAGVASYLVTDEVYATAFLMKTTADTDFPDFGDVILRETATTGTDAGDLTTTPVQRDLNAIENANGRVTLSSGEFTFQQAGDWFVSVHVPALACGAHRAWIENTLTGDKVYSSSAYTDTGDTVVGDAWITARLTVATGDTFKLMHQATTNKTGDGRGSATSIGGDEIYATLVLSQASHDADLPDLNALILQETTALGVDAGDMTMSVVYDRPVTEVDDPANAVTLSSGEFTFVQDGEWLVILRSPAYNTDKHRLRLHNVTTGTTTHYGSSVFSRNADNSDTVQVDSWLFAHLTVSAGETYVIQHSGSDTATDGLGRATHIGGDEIYAEGWLFPKLTSSDTGGDTTTGSSQDVTVTYGEAVSEREVCYLKPSDNKWYKFDIDADPVQTGTRLGICVESGGVSADSDGLMRLGGVVEGFSGLTPGGKVYASTTPGGITQAEPNPILNGTQITVAELGYATSDTEIYFQPDNLKFMKRATVGSSDTLTITHPADPSGRLRQIRGALSTDEVSNTDLLSTGTATAKAIYNNSNPNWCIDNNESTRMDLRVQMMNGYWWQCDLGAGNEQAFGKFYYKPVIPDYGARAFYIAASNTGDFTGEEIILLEVAEEAWDVDEFKEWYFTVTQPYRYYRLYITDTNSQWCHIRSLKMFPAITALTSHFTPGWWHSTKADFGSRTGDENDQNKDTATTIQNKSGSSKDLTIIVEVPK